MLKFLSLSVFLISFTIGVLIVYNTTTQGREIMVYPTPENVNQLLYKDSAEQCYQFTPQEVACPRDKTNIKSIPPQN